MSYVEEKSSINEHIDRIKYISNYKINEANYTLVSGIDEDDTIPDDIWKSPQPVSAVDSNVHEDDENLDNQEDTTNSETDIEIENDIETTPDGEEEVSIDQSETIDDTPEKSTDELQNDIIKKSLSAMNKMNDELRNLESSISGLNNRINILNSDVEEVKEPTNVEKLMSKKDDSHPYYYNLNDMWDDSRFQARRQTQDINNSNSDISKGMRKLPDGTYIADFDSLPKYNEQEIKDSF